MTENLFDKAKNMGLENIPYSDDISVLTKEIDFGDGVAKNRIAIQPMEGATAKKAVFRASLPKDGIFVLQKAVPE